MRKRTKLILSILIGVLVIGTGTVFALAKTGKIHLSIFADPVTTGNLTVSVHKNGGASSWAGIDVGIAYRADQNSAYTYDKTVKTDSAGTATFNGIKTSSSPSSWYVTGLSTDTQCGTATLIGNIAVSAGSTTYVPITLCAAAKPETQVCEAGHHYDAAQNKCVDDPSYTFDTIIAHGKVLDSAGVPLAGVKISGKYNWNGADYGVAGTSQSAWYTDDFSPDAIKEANYKLGNIIKSGLSTKITLTYELSGYNTVTQDISPSGLTPNKRIPDISLYKPSEVAVTIKGQLFKLNENNKHVGLQGIINLQKSDGSMFNNVTTDTNGNYQTNLTTANLASLNNTVLVKGLYDVKDSTGKVLTTITGYYESTPGNRTGTLVLENGKTYNNIDVMIVGIPAVGSTITGKITDKNGKPIRNNAGVYARIGGFPENFSPNQITDFDPFQFNAVTDEHGNYKITVEPAQLYQSFNLGICAMVEKFPNDINHRNFRCYKNGTDRVLPIVAGKNYQNIDIIMSDYTFNLDFSTFNLIGYYGETNYIDSEVFCEDCTKGPWAISPKKKNDAESVLPAFEYLTKDIYNIAQFGSTVNRLKIKPIYRWPSDKDYYFDINDNYTKDDPEFIEITPSEITANAYVGQDGKLYLRKDLNVRSVKNTKDNRIVVYGKMFIKDSMDLVDANNGIWVKNSLKGVGLLRAQQTLFFPFSNPNPNSNFIMSPLPYLPNESYTMTLRNVKFRDEYYAPEKLDITLDITKAKYDNDLRVYVLKQDVELSKVTKDKVRITYKDELTGQPFNLEKAGIKYTNLSCELRSGEVIECLDSYGLLSPSEDPSRSIVEYTLGVDLLPRDWHDSNQINYNNRGPIFMSTNNGWRGSTFGGPLTNNDMVVYLRDSNLSQNFDDKYYCETFNEITFCSILADKSLAFTDSIRQYLKNTTSRLINSFFNTAGGSQPAVLLSATLESAFDPRGWDEGNLRGKPKIILNISNSGLSTNTIIHESSHAIEQRLASKDKILYYNALAAARAGNCDIEYSQYKCFSDYSVNNPNGAELWAEFATKWLLNNDNTRKAMSDPNMSANCKNSLKYLYQFMIEKFPGLKSYRKPESLSAASSKVALSIGLNGKVLGASTAESLSTILAESGYEEAPLVSIDTIAPLSQMTLTADQIASGVWLKDGYNQLPVKEKAQIQLNILTTRARNTIISAGAVMQNTLQNINTQIDKLLKTLGFKVTNASISGTLKDQDGPVIGMEISFGNKIAATDNSGNFKIVRVPTGKFDLKIFDPKIDKTYSATPSFLSIANNQQVDNINIVLNRPLYNIKGQIYQGDKTLNNGKLIIDGNQTVNLDATGKFNFKLKEGQHQIVIKNKNNKTVSVVNSGKYNNLSRLNVVNDFDSLIWVK